MVSVTKLIIFLFILSLFFLSSCDSYKTSSESLCSMEIVRGDLSEEICKNDLDMTFEAFKTNDIQKCDSISVTELKNSCKESIGKYSFTEWVKFYYGMSDAQLQTTMSKLGTQECSKDCSKYLTSIRKVSISPGEDELGNIVTVEVQNDGACTTKITGIEIYSGEELACAEELTGMSGANYIYGKQRQVPIGGWNYVSTRNCNISCITYDNGTISATFTKAILKTDCGTISAGIEKLKCNYKIISESS